MIPLKRHVALSPAALAVFNGLRGEAREKAMATGLYDEVRQPGEDLEEIDPLSEATQA